MKRRGHDLLVIESKDISEVKKKKKKMGLPEKCTKRKSSFYVLNPSQLLNH